MRSRAGRCNGLRVAVSSVFGSDARGDLGYAAGGNQQERGMTGAGVRRVFLVLGVVMATGMVAAGALAQTTGGQATGGPVVTHENKIKGTARSAISRAAAARTGAAERHGQGADGGERADLAADRAAPDMDAGLGDADGGAGREYEERGGELGEAVYCGPCATGMVFIRIICWRLVGVSPLWPVKRPGETATGSAHEVCCRRGGGACRDTRLRRGGRRDVHLFGPV